MTPTTFITESNLIEGIHRAPTSEEVSEFERFMLLRVITIDELKKFVSVYQPNAVLRDRPHLNVRIGTHRPPRGGSNLVAELMTLLTSIEDGGASPYEAHLAYEMIHPFTDGNGRSGRMLWAWMMGRTYIDMSDIGFLHRFYYQTLGAIQSALAEE